MILVLNILQNLVVMVALATTLTVLLSARLVILTTVVTELPLVALMDVQATTLTALLSVRLVRVVLIPVLKALHHHLALVVIMLVQLVLLNAVIPVILV